MKLRRLFSPLVAAWRATLPLLIVILALVIVVLVAAVPILLPSACDKSESAIACTRAWLVALVPAAALLAAVVAAVLLSRQNQIADQARAALYLPQIDADIKVLENFLRANAKIIISMDLDAERACLDLSAEPIDALRSLMNPMPFGNFAKFDQWLLLPIFKGTLREPVEAYNAAIAAFIEAHGAMRAQMLADDNTGASSLSKWPYDSLYSTPKVSERLAEQIRKAKVALLLVFEASDNLAAQVAPYLQELGETRTKTAHGALTRYPF